MQDIECVFESMTGRGSIFISNLPAAQNIALLHSKGIGAILSVARSGLLQHTRDRIPHYLYIPAEDHQDYALNIFFDQTFAFIEKARKETNVLVHCMAGISRSVTIVIAYLLKKYKYTLQQVITMMHRRRRKINPNPGFMEQLKKYAENEGIQCNIGTNFIRSLREQSPSKNKKITDLSKQKPYSRAVAFSLGHRDKKEVPSLKTTDLIQFDKKDELFLDLPKPGCIHLKKIKSFEESKTNVFDRENEENDLFKRRQDICEKKKEFFQQKAPLSVCERKRGLSIEEKIKKVRDKIMKKEENRHEGEGLMRTSANFSPIYRKSPKKLEESSLEKHNRNKILRENTQTYQILKEKTHHRLHSFSSNTQNDVSGPVKPTSLLHYKMAIQPEHHIKSEQTEKDLFADCLQIDTSLYSHLKLHKRVNSRLSQEPYY